MHQDGTDDTLQPEPLDIVDDKVEFYIDRISAHFLFNDGSMVIIRPHRRTFRLPDNSAIYGNVIGIQEVLLYRDGLLEAFAFGLHSDNGESESLLGDDGCEPSSGSVNGALFSSRNGVSQKELVMYWDLVSEWAEANHTKFLERQMGEHEWLGRYWESWAMTRYGQPVMKSLRDGKLGISLEEHGYPIEIRSTS